ncbi:MAG: hypothetical protein AMXMBFR83_07100 [Phycisphaerae bacterium]|jgi:hypothetical protein
MSRLPVEPEGGTPQGPVAPPSMPPLFSSPSLPRTSGWAVASVILGSVGLVTCCALLPSILGMVFGLVALPAIRRGEVTGRASAVLGVVFSVIGLVLGAGFWIVVAVSPSSEPVTGAEVSRRDYAWLESRKVIQAGESIDLLFSDGLLSLREGGVVLTDQRLVTYSSSGPEESCRLDDIMDISFTAGDGWLDEGAFVVTARDGRTITFTIGSVGSGDKRFEWMLRTRTTTSQPAGSDR